MKHENINWQLTSLEESKRLRELGVPQDSLFSHLITISGFEKIEKSYHDRKQFEDVFGKVIEEYSAFTVAELGEMLPVFVWHKSEKDKRKKVKKHLFSFISDDDNTLKVVYKSDNDDGMEDGWIVCEDENVHTEANSRAKMLIYLIENNLIEVK